MKPIEPSHAEAGFLVSVNRSRAFQFVIGTSLAGLISRRFKELFAMLTLAPAIVGISISMPRSWHI